MQNCVETVELPERKDTPSQTDDRKVHEELLIMMNKAKQISTTIKKSVVSNFSTNLDNMYQSGKKSKKAVDVTLNVLLKLHLQPQKERDERKRIDELKKGLKIQGNYLIVACSSTIQISIEP